MDCAKVRIELEALIAGSLEGDARASVEDHLDRCEACRRERDAIRGLLEVLRLAGPGHAPAALPLGPARARARILPLRAPAVAAAIAAALLLSLLGAAWWRARAPGEHPAPAQVARNDAGAQGNAAPAERATPPVSPTREQLPPRASPGPEETPERAPAPREEAGPPAGPSTARPTEGPVPVVHEPLEGPSTGSSGSASGETPAPAPPSPRAAPPGTEERPAVPPVVVATVASGAARLDGPARQDRSPIVAGTSLRVRAGGEAVAIELAGGGALLLAAGSETRLEADRAEPLLGESVIDLRDRSTPLAISLAGLEASASDGTRVAVDAGSTKKPRLSAGVLDGSLGLPAGSGAPVTAGFTLRRVKEGKWARSRGGSREPDWARRVRGAGALLDLERDLAEEPLRWRPGKRTRVKSRYVLELEPVKDPWAGVGATLDDLRFRNFGRVRVEADVISTARTTLTLQLFDETRRDNYQLLADLQPGVVRHLAAPLAGLTAADQSGTPIGVGHGVHGIALFAGAPGDRPSVTVLALKVVRDPD